MIETVSPVDGSVYATREEASPAEVDAALAAAVAAQQEWRRVPVEERVSLCRRAADWLVERADELGEELTWQMGRPVSQSPGELRRGFAQRVAHMGDIAADSLADHPTPKGFIRREPLGVVLVLAPWNYPWLSSVNAVAPALVAGNTVVLKTASQTPLVAERYAEAFAAAALPEGVFSFLHLDHSQVADAIGDERVTHVAFTGSVEGGHAVQRAAAERFLAPTLELGGKDPAYVRPDADVAFAATELADGAFFNAGQSCCGVERIYVHRDVYDEFVDAFCEEARALRLGNPLDPETTLGPMVRTAAADFVRGQVAEALEQGAKSLLDGEGDQPGTPYMAPVVLVDVDHGMRVMTEETFGPVAGIMPVGNDGEAVALMNDSRYGLTASVWTADVDTAVALGDQIETGTCYVNRCDYLDPALAWTGVKDSGRGVSLSPYGYDALTRPKSFYTGGAS